MFTVYKLLYRVGQHYVCIKLYYAFSHFIWLVYVQNDNMKAYRPFSPI